VPSAWDPPEDTGLTGVFATNDRLGRLVRLGEGIGRGPEDIAIDAEGRIHVGYADGRIARFAPDGSSAETLANTGGRPFGMRFAPDGDLIVADALRGILAVSPDGAVETLVTEVDGAPLGFPDAVAVARDGRIFFSDASIRFGLGRHLESIVERGGDGRLFELSREKSTVRLLVDGLHFANGVAVVADLSFVLVAETAGYRVLRHWLAGHRAGQTEVFVDNLPGFPDNISTGEHGLFWVALTAPRDPLLDRLGPYPALRKVLFRIPTALRPGPRRHAHVVGIDRFGRVVASHQRDRARFSSVTSAVERSKMLYLGSVAEQAFARLPLP